MDLIARLTRHPRAALWWGFVAAVGSGVAILVFGAPAWILVAVNYAGLTLYAVADGWRIRHESRGGPA